jgi:hypothetical protein
MERPVQSFKSFVRTLPPSPNTSDENDKPLPPTPSSDQSLPPLLSSPLATSTESAWKAPTEWEWDNPSPPSQVPTTSIFTARNYSPLIPEPSPGLSSMQTESSSWPFKANASQYPRLQPIRERSKSRPNTPPRNPFKAIASLYSFRRNLSGLEYIITRFFLFDSSLSTGHAVQEASSGFSRRAADTEYVKALFELRISNIRCFNESKGVCIVGYRITEEHESCLGRLVEQCQRAPC